MAIIASFCYANDLTDIGKSFEQICTENGFNFESHKVVTEDGYILQQFRIPSKGSPVFFQHGFIDSAMSWIVHQADLAPAFIAARQGYDVWLGNSRGNTFSQKHVSLDAFDQAAQYWDFSWTEMGMKDLPASFDYISEQTGYPKIAYVGHSQGTT